MKKRLISIILVTICLVSCIMPVLAYANGIMPRWDNANSVSATINFSGTTGVVRINILGDTEVSNITATATLYHKNWLGIWVESGEEWSYNVNQSYLSASESFTGKSGRQYKVELTGTVTKNGYAESVSASATAEC